MSQFDSPNNANGLEIAIIGMSGRFPGANSVEQLWRNLCDGVESISFFSEEELIASEVSPASLSDPSYVKARGVIEEMEKFDAALFAIHPREAEVMDPQHRLFLECAWEALEQSGYDASRYSGAIGVFGGAGMNSYLMNVLSNPEVVNAVGGVLAGIGNDKDHLTTRVSYKLGLRGPAVTVQTACSTSLVAVHLACQSLLNAECDMALAGGVSIILPQKAGYFHQEGGIFSPDGHCRPFDANAQGTVFSNGVGIVVLKRLEDALAEGDTIHAVIKGSAINNDGSLKVGYAAPSVEGQLQVIKAAQIMAEVEAGSIGYVETHGTGTALGDPIEFAALWQAFGSHSSASQSCALGSIKANIGHLDTAAGVTGLIKATLALKHNLIPPCINFAAPNAEIDLANSPFFINTEGVAWPERSGPRRAGVSSFGIGGTNAHVILEESPQRQAKDEAAAEGRAHKLLVLSAKTRESLEAATQRLALHLEANPNQSVADLAYTLQVGRRAFSVRRVIVASQGEQARREVEEARGSKVLTGGPVGAPPRVVFMFPGQGSQYARMGWGLYGREEVFTHYLDESSRIFKEATGEEIREVLYGGLDKEEAQRRLKETRLTQGALFAVEYALARQWMKWGVRPWGMIGHSIGEVVAACIAGVMEFEEGVRLVAARGELMSRAGDGAMTAVNASLERVERELAGEMGELLSIAAINGPRQVVVSGPQGAVEEMESRLKEEGVRSRRLETSHAFHSRMMGEASEEFEREAEKVRMKRPAINYISNVTGRWAGEEVTRGRYWGEQMRRPVMLWEGLEEVKRQAGGEVIMLEVGPGEGLKGLVKGQMEGIEALSSLGRDEDKEQERLTRAVGELWVRGVEVDWESYSGGQKRRRVEAPGYEMQRERYWLEVNRDEVNKSKRGGERGKQERRAGKVEEMLYVPVWKQSVREQEEGEGEGRGEEVWVVLKDKEGVAEEVVRRGREAGAEVVEVGEGGEREAIEETLREAEKRGKRVSRVVDLRAVGDEEADGGFYGLLSLAQALGTQDRAHRVRLAIVTSNLQDVTGEEVIFPQKASALAFCKVIPKEYPNLSCCSIDVAVPELDEQRERIADQLASELLSNRTDSIIAYRGKHRWVQSFDAVRLPHPKGHPKRLRESGVYLITGGLGAIGLSLAEYLAHAVRGKLVLIGRSPFPARDEWEGKLAGADGGDQVSKRIRRLQAIESLGSEIFLASADVTSEKQMRDVVAQTRRRFGQINGVIHAAGIPGGGLIQLKTLEMAAPVLAPKVQGTLVLEQVLKDEELDFFVLCSSALAIVGALGQVDYCAANSFLDAFARGRNSSRSPLTISINWDAWREDGMGVHSGNSKQRTPARSTSRAEKLDSPLFDSRVIESPERQIYISEFRSDKHWMLGEHRIMGDAIMPATAYLEMARSAFQLQGYGETLEMREVTFQSPLVIADNEAREVHTILERNGDEIGFRIVSKAESMDGAETGFQGHVSGRLKALNGVPVNISEVSKIAQRCNRRKVVSSDHDQPGGPGSHLVLGPRWKSLKQVQVGENEVLALLELPAEFSGDLEKFGLHPSLLDAATGVMARESMEGFYLPLSYQKVRINGPLPGKIYSHITHKQNGKGETLTFDVAILDEHGEQRVEIEGFILRRVTGAPARLRSQAGRVVPRAAADSGTPARRGEGLARSERSTANGVNYALSIEEGVEAFARILSGAESSQVIVSARDIHAAIEQGEALSESPGFEQAVKSEPPAQIHSRPSLPTPFVAPENELQQGLAAIWQGLLGIDRIGIHDNFFDLGGHSLLTLQFMSRLRDTFQVTLPINDVFEKPTIAELADAVQAAVMEKIIAKIDGMSEKEAESLLQQEADYLLRGNTHGEPR